MKHFMRPGLAIALLAAAALVSSAHAGVRRLENGLTVLLEPDSEATAVDVAVWYRAGSTTEAAGQSGLTQLFGRLMYQGSSHFGPGEHARLLQADGGVINAVTHPDYTCFYQTVPPEDLDLALELEADRMASLRIGKESLEAERRAAIEDRHRRVDPSALARGLERLNALAFAGHPYSRPVIGVGADLERVTLADAMAYYRARFSPNNAVLTVVGSFDPVPTLAAIRRRFGPIPRRSLPPGARSALRPQAGERRGSFTANAQGPILLVGWRGPGDAQPDNVSLELLASILGGGASARLGRTLVGGTSPFLDARGDFDRRKEASLIYIAAALRPGADTASAEQALVGAVESLATTPIPAEELDRGKRQVQSALLFSLETVRGEAQAIGTAQLMDGDYRATEARLARLRQLTPEDLLAAAARVLKPATRSLVWVMPAGADSSAARPGSSGAGERR